MGKKLRLVFFGLILVVVVGFFASQPNRLHYGDNGTLSVVGNLDKNEQVKILGSINKRDSDNDGLKDWEEELWGTNPKDPDTDSDGTKDGEEVDLGRDPNLAGPDDDYQEGVFVKQNSEDFLGDLTETERFSQEFFEEYLSLKQSGTDFNSKDAQSFLINSAFEKMQISDDNKTYTSADITIVNSNSEDALKAYGNLMASIISKNPINSENEVVILKRALETNNEKELEKLNSTVSIYKDILNEALQVQVPQSMIDVHLAFINVFLETISITQGMLVVFSDPITALNSTTMYQNNAENLIDVFKDIQEAFKKQNIFFEKHEKGYALNPKLI